MSTRKRLSSKMPLAKILEALALAGKALTKYDLQKRNIPTQSVYEWIPRMLKDGLIEEDESQRRESRVGLPQRYYRLTVDGWVAASGLVSNIKIPGSESLPGLAVYVDISARRQKQRREQQIQPWLHVIRQVYITERAAPGWSLTLTMKSDKDGKVKSKISAGF
jgi:DNA-binding PadR family transcriptional regulator